MRRAGLRGAARRSAGATLPTIALVPPNRSATALLATPPAQASTRLARRTSAAGSDRDRASDASCVRSSWLKLSSAFGRPLAIEVSPSPLRPQALPTFMILINGTVH
jgi:hypothetical protein